MIGGVGLLVILYGLNFFVPKRVVFNYGGQTCYDQLTIFPVLQKSNDSTYDISFDNSWNIGSAPVASTKTCFKTKDAPKEGSKIVGTSLFDGPFARTIYSVIVPAAPLPKLQAVKKEIAVTKSLEIPIKDGDVVHAYRLVVGTKSVPCTSGKDKLACDVPSLNLAQGARYDYVLQRSFNNRSSRAVGSGSFETLRAVAVTNGTAKPGQVLYARPKTLTFTTDKPIASASVTLQQDDKSITLTQSVSGTTLSLALKDELPREKTYELVIDKLEAKDGSTLVEPYRVPFKTSGGPKVVSVSVAAIGVNRSAAIILTFDQAVSKTKDVTPFVAFAGGKATIRKYSATQVVVQLNALPLCQQFTIMVKQGIPSEYDLVSAQPWSFSGRTICHQVTTYGNSVRGRPLTAVIFGTSGPVTMYVGGIHGNETSSTSLMRSWMTQLEANPTRFAGKRVVVVPDINPDGSAARTRTNARGVNLNRNFPTDNWVKSIKDTDGTHPSGGGESPLSEPEAAALANLTVSYRPRLLLSFHAVGGLAIGDPGGYSAGYAAKYASLVGYRDGTSSSSTNFDYNVTGAYEDWTYRNQGIPSIVVELTSYTSVNYTGHYKALWAMLE